MTSASHYTFRRVTLDDLALLEAWQKTPHVGEWWDASEPYSEADLADIRVARWIVSRAARPFAFMQDYAVHGWEEHHFSYLPKGSRGIDQFIGEADMVGIGHGSAFIAMRMQSLFDDGAPVIATDPHPDNERAIAVYRKLGFEQVGSPQETRWGLILPMLARR
ncbi:GNAT family N-acetyltransferase [Cohaesibacter intestini]|uniref:GNAT family N-acetyltransferase n=1 Tax=Cohaesibacter intestini TaxID=2211145 RepID=UPI001300614A|nr:GNAT family N-acetyltransferase [Cohaesibacter intestini]